jgi:predicted dehydrogenase
VEAVSREEPIRVGLAGSGPWARSRYAPLFAAGPETRLSAVWSRTSESAHAVADLYGAHATHRFDEFLDRCDAVAICVPPAVQAELAVHAANRAKPLLLDKPLTSDLSSAERLAAEVIDSGVPTMHALTFRFAPAVRSFLQEAATFEATGAHACMLSSSRLSGPYADSPWRAKLGVLFNEGPHVLDLVDAAAGRIVAAQAQRRDDWIGMILEHASGALSEVTLANRVQVPGSVMTLGLFGQGGVLQIDAAAGLSEETYATLRRDFAAVSRGGSHPVDITRALEVQRSLHLIEHAIDQGSRVARSVVLGDARRAER